MSGEVKILAFAEGVSVTAPTQTPLTTYTRATKTTTYTATTADEVLICDTTSGAFTLTLPTAVGNDGKSFWIVKIGTAALDLTIDGNGAETIDGQATMLLSGQYKSVQIVSNNANWFSIAKHEETVVSKTTTYTATNEDDVILCATASGWTLTLPAVAGSKGKIFKIVKTSLDANALTIDGASSETIDGDLTTTLDSQYQSITIMSDGVAWFTIAREKAVLQVVSKTTTYTAVNNDDLILVTTGSAWTLTLPTAIGIKGKKLRIMKTSSDVNALTIDGNASETINGATTFSLVGQYESIEIVSDGANWIKVASANPAISAIELTSGNGFGAVSTNVRRYSTVTTNTGNLLTLAQDANSGDSITVNKTGRYCIYGSDQNSSGDNAFGAQVNATTLAFDGTTKGLGGGESSSVSKAGSFSWVGKLTVADIVRVCGQTVANMTSSTSIARFGMVYLGD